jgi:membrane protein
MPEQSIATTTAKQHSHITTPDASTPPRRAWLEACVIAGGVGMIASAAIVCLQGGVLASLTGVEQVLGWLLAAWSASILAQSVITLRQSHRTDRYWQRIAALSLLAINAVFMTGSTLYAFWVLQIPLKVGVQSNAMIIVSDVLGLVGSLYLWYLLLGTQPALPARSKDDGDCTTKNQMMKRKVGFWLMVGPVMPLAMMHGVLLFVLLCAHGHDLDLFTSDVVKWLGTMSAVRGGVLFVISTAVYGGITWVVIAPIAFISGLWLVATSKYE